MPWKRIGSLRSIDAFRDHLAALGLELPCDETPLSSEENSPLAAPMVCGKLTIGNRWCVHPMEGWDATPSGTPTEQTLRRWKHFGQSGCKLIWGGEAVAVRHDGRANPNQLFHDAKNSAGLKSLHETLLQAHREAFGGRAVEDLVVGLQLTHSGRFSRPREKDQIEPRIAYHHPLLDEKFGIDPKDDSVIISDREVRELIDDYVAAAKTAQTLGYQFVDIKSCHGYLLHEFLSAYSREGPYGGDFEGRTRLLREIIAAVRSECPVLEIGVRLSLFDFPPFRPDENRTKSKGLGEGVPQQTGEHYPIFGARRENPLQRDLTEPIALIRRLRDELGVQLFNLSAGSPYYNPHVQRPAYYPPSDGYQPPEDPLVGCVRQIHAVRETKRAVPDVLLVGTAYTYFQEYLPHVAQAVVRAGWVDSVGIGRLILSDWTLPARVLAGEDYRAAKKICRTFSDCTTGPRNGLISGCYPLDDYYKQRPEAEQIKAIKSALRGK